MNDCVCVCVCVYICVCVCQRIEEWQEFPAVRRGGGLSSYHSMSSVPGRGATSLTQHPHSTHVIGYYMSVCACVCVWVGMRCLCQTGFSFDPQWWQKRQHQCIAYFWEGMRLCFLASSLWSQSTALWVLFRNVCVSMFSPRLLWISPSEPHWALFKSSIWVSQCGVDVSVYAQVFKMTSEKEGDLLHDTGVSDVNT